MATRKSKRTKVFVSYSRHDEAWLERLRVHLKPLQRELEIDIWDDSKIDPGKEWKDEIAKAIDSTKVAVLLISANFMASDFIATGELPRLLNAARDDGAILVPLILSSSRFGRTTVSAFETINDPKEERLVDLTWGRQEEVLNRLAEFIENAFTVTEEAKTPKAKPVPPVPESPARKQTRSPQDIPELKALLDELKLELEATLWDRGQAETAIQIGTTVLMEGLEAIAQRAHPKRLERNLRNALEGVSSRITEGKKPFTEKDVSKFIQVHSGDREIAEMFSTAISKFGAADRPIVIEFGRFKEVHFVEGMKFDHRGSFASEFINDRENRRVVIRSPRFLITEKTLRFGSEVSLLGRLLSPAHEKLVLIAGDFEEDVLAALIGVTNQTTIPVKAPGYGDRRREMLRDIAILTGGTLISDDDSRGLAVDISELGSARTTIIDEENTTIVDGHGSTGDVQNRIQEIKLGIEQTSSDYDREKFQERLAKLLGGVAVIRPGGRTEEERQQRTQFFEWVLRLYNGALRDGVVPGEHLSLVNAATHLRKLTDSDEEQLAGSILAQALEAPFQRMVEGLGRSGEETLVSIRAAQEKQKNQNVGYYGDEDSFVDLVKAGVVVPTGMVVEPVEAAVRFAAEKLGSLRYTDELVQQFSSR